MNARPSVWKRHAHVWGPLLSLLAHLLLVLLLVYAIRWRVPEPPPRHISVTRVEPDDRTFDPPPEPRDDPTEPPPSGEPSPLAPPDWIDAEPEPVPLVGQELPTAAAPEPPPEPGRRLALPLGLDAEHARRDPTQRREAAALLGDRWNASRAVDRALRWLKEHQSADGSWPGREPAAMTGLALLTFLAHGETPASDEYGVTVRRALDFLLAKQDAAGRFSGNVYAHAIATYALCDACSMTRNPLLTPPAARAARVILKGQQPGGGWDYNYKGEGRRDTSVAGWQIQALRAARLAHLDLPGLDEALDRAARDLLSAQSRQTGRFAYSAPGGGGSDAMTGVGVLGLQMTGQGGGEAARRGLAALADQTCDWKAASAWGLYGWYYITQAHFHHGERVWERWNARFAPEFIRRQNEDGSWTPPGNEKDQGLVYGTTLAALTLQVYHRTLPSYREVPVQRAAPAPDPEEVLVEIL